MYADRRALGNSKVLSIDRNELPFISARLVIWYNSKDRDSTSTCVEVGKYFLVAF